jgi:molybdopterin-guanine dinucleotide biosynthesis protein A
MAQATLATVILAGGQSRRMGQDKALIEWDGQPLLVRTYETVRALSTVVCVMSPRCDRYRRLLPSDCLLLPEAQPDGPLMALNQALPCLIVDWVLVLACDLPHLDGAILQQASQQLDQLPADVVAWVPRRGDRWEPLCGFYRRQCRAALQIFAQQGGRSFQRWLDTIPVQEWRLEHPQMLINCNTPDELEQARQKML